jgi:hypothetical protein
MAIGSNRLSTVAGIEGGNNTGDEEMFESTNTGKGRRRDLFRFIVCSKRLCAERTHWNHHSNYFAGKLLFIGHVNFLYKDIT